MIVEISVIVGGIVALAMIYAITRYQFQLLADDTALKREKQQAELALKKRLIESGNAGSAGLDAILAADMLPASTAEIDAILAKRFGSLDADGKLIEEALHRALATTPERKRAIRDVIDELMENDTPHDAILAAVSALCRQTPRESAPASVA